MGSLVNCLRKAGEAGLARGAQERIAERAARLEEDGVAANVAGVQAASEYLTSLELERADVVRQIRAAGGVAPEAAPPAGEKIEDFGEKIGGARKDVAEKTELRAIREETRETDRGTQMYSIGGRQTGETPASIRAVLVRRFGERLVNALENARILKIVSTAADIRGVAVDQRARGVYDDNLKTGYLIADKLTRHTATQVLLHEIGEHYNLETFLGAKGWRALSAKVRIMAMRDGSQAAAVWDQVKTTYTEFRGRTDADLSHDDRFMHEVVAALGESQAFRRTSAWRDIVTAIKTFLLKHFGFTGQLRDDDIGRILEGSLQHAARTAKIPTQAETALADDLDQQTAFLEEEARRRGFPSVDEFVAQDMDGFMAAAEQWRASHAMASLNQTRTTAFERWFGDSVVTKDGKRGGEPLVVYHVTDDNIEKFDFSRLGATTDENTGGDQTAVEVSKLGFWTHERALNSEMGKSVAMPLFVSIENPGLVNLRQLWTDINDAAERGEESPADAVRQMYESDGYDGLVVYDEEFGGRSFVAFRPEQIKSAIGNAGTFDADNPNILFSIGAGSQQWGSPDMSRLDNIIYTLQDKHVDTKRVIEAIRESGVAVTEGRDVYLQEELFHGRAAKMVDDFISDELKPLVTAMALHRVPMADLEEYLHARHAEERNQAIARINHDMPDGGSGMTTQDARDYLAGLDPGKRKSYEALAKRVDSITDGTRTLLVAYGLESQDTIDAWEQAYKSYVPLQREDMEGGMGIGQGFSVRGPSSKRATGSGRKVVDILANVVTQREKAIARGEKNVVANALVGLARAAPNDGFWRVDRPPVQKIVNERTGQVEERVDPLYKSRPNVVVARTPNAAGQVDEHVVVFNEYDERAVRMAAALKNLDIDDMGRVLGVAARATRYFASVNTQYNPVFGIVNLVRDAQGAALNLSSTPLAGKQREVLGNALSALRGIYIDIRDIRQGKHPTSTWAQLWEEFEREGGKTGYRDMFRTSADRAAAIQKEINRVTEGRAKQFGRAVFDWLSDYNEAMENAVRLSAYRSAKDAGLSRQRAASLAKNLTVNFNRKGQVATQMGALYAFFNASVQGTARMAETLTGPAGKKILAGGLLLGVAQAVMMAAAGFDDDEPPYFIRERNTVIPIGGKRYIAIPMPLGLHVIPNIGRVVTEWFLGGFRDTGKRVTEIMGSAVDAFNPVGSAGLSLQTIAPTVIDPLAALAENKDWTGKPIARPDRSSLAPTPGHTRAKDTASWLGTAVSKSLNWLSGGTNYKPGAFSPTPDQIDFLVGQLTGGVGRELGKVEQTVAGVVTGDKIPTYKIPLAGRFYGNLEDASSHGNRYYGNIRELSEHEAEIKGRLAHKEPVEAYYAANPEARLVGLGNLTERAVNELRRRRRALAEAGADRARIEAVDAAITARMRVLNEAVRRAKAGESGRQQSGSASTPTRRAAPAASALQ